MSDLSAAQEVSLDGPDPLSSARNDSYPSDTGLDSGPLEGDNQGGTVDEGDASLEPDFDWSAHADEHVTVRIDGQEVRVPLKEALAGYSRQEDYTRKTQALSLEREEVATAKALKNALDADPQRTIAALQGLYGVQATKEMVAEVQEYDDPSESRLAQLEQRFAQQEQERQRATIVAEARSAVAASGMTGVTENDLLAFATENQIGNLKTAARLMKVEQAELGAVETTKKNDAKLRTGVVDRGTGRAPGSTGAPQVKTLADAFRLAKKQHGIRDD